MPDTDTLTARVRSIERALTDADSDAALQETERLDALADRLTALENRINGLDGDVQAVRGLAGELEHVNDTVERRADAALAAADRLETDRQDPVSRLEPASVQPTPSDSSRAAVPPTHSTDTASGDSDATENGTAESDPGFLARLRALR